MNAITYVLVGFSLAAGLVAALALVGAILEQQHLKRMTEATMPALLDAIAMQQREGARPREGVPEEGVPEGVPSYVFLLETVSLDVLAASERDRTYIAHLAVRLRRWQPPTFFPG
jgi:hypothetical protein